MPSSPIASTPSPATSQGGTWQIVGFVYFTFICYIAISLPLAVLPPFVHLRMGYNAALAGLVISIQSFATLCSRPWAGRICDLVGAKISVMWGVGACAVSGVFLVIASALYPIHWLCFSFLLVSRLLLGVGQSLGSTGSILWGVSSAGQKYMAKVISFNGIACYGAMALGAPLGVVMEQHWGLASLGLVIIFICAVSLVVASCKSPIPVLPGTHLSFSNVLGRVAPHGLALAMGGMGFSVLIMFITLFYASRHWNGAALCLTAFGVAFILVRLFFAQIIDQWGGFQVAIASLAVEVFGPGLLWLASAPWMALAGALLVGCGFSLVYPALGVEAVKRVPIQNRGTALAIFSVCSDVSFFLTGPIAGTMIGIFGYASAFLFALLCVFLSLGITIVLRYRTERSAPLA
jgi:MFS family permease